MNNLDDNGSDIKVPCSVTCTINDINDSLESRDDQVQHQGGKIPRRADDKACGEPLNGEAQWREVDQLEMPVYRPVMATQSLVEDIHVVHQTRAVRVK